MAKKKDILNNKEKKIGKKLTKSVIQYKMDSNKRKFLKALKDTRGLVTLAAKRANLSRSRHYEWCKEDADYKAKVDAINDLMVENVENKLGDLIEDNNTAAIIFYLKTKGRDKGYGNQIKVDAKVEGEITVNPIKIIKPGE